MEEFDLDKRIFKGLEGLDMLKFAIINLVSCNGTKSISFSEVSCDYEVLRDKTDRRTCFFPFQLIFNYGVSFLESLEKASSDDIKNMEPHMKKAVLRLNAFYKSIEYNQTCLKKVFDMKLKGEEMAATETDISITLAEHLLGKLAPGESYKIDNKAREKKSCRCGCKVTPVFDGTGIGHEQVWHGFIDIVFSSHLGIHSMANAVLDIEENISKKRRVDEQDETKNDDSPGGKTITQVKQPLSENMLSQAIAQTIVFSLVQKQKHPEFLHHMIPNIVISPEKLEIMMYDSDNDVLLCSNPILLFNLDLPDDRTLIDETVLIIWMVLHYRIFCSGLNKANPYLLERCKSNFRQLVASKWDIYSKSLKSCVPGFPSVEKWPISELIQCGKKLKFESDDF
ncbi:uncharacterized protein LOC128171201 isoform X1 [Crassostrea angulata]|uniref:uncharacterized protein LOC128171201 isoform X1 n=1 Tax=Magallana angulata TaxID=2784310 RepID=UPI0022B11132|nr:uncharacterized protein LOC128171201 isoform X1 [Crassostrea angulata]